MPEDIQTPTAPPGCAPTNGSGTVETHPIWRLDVKGDEHQPIFTSFESAVEYLRDLVGDLMDNDTIEGWNVEVQSENWTREDFEECGQPWPGETTPKRFCLSCGATHKAALCPHCYSDATDDL